MVVWRRRSRACAAGNRISRVGSPGSFKVFADAFREALSEGGYVEGRNVAIEYRWAEGETARLPEMAAELVRHRVSLIIAGGLITARAAQAVTSTIPILFISGPNPVADGLVSSLSRPGGNLAGELCTPPSPKRLKLLNGLVPRGKTIAFLVNPTNIANQVEVKDIEDATRTTGQQAIIVKAAS
jgi:putative ABC transport system substrate-binding protein